MGGGGGHKQALPQVPLLLVVPLQPGWGWGHHLPRKAVLLLLLLLLLVVVVVGCHPLRALWVGWGWVLLQGG